MASTIFITGASSGIGGATAARFIEQGWNVVATMRNPQDGAALRDRDGVLVSCLDVTDEKSIETSVSQALDRFGSIDVLVNNAGYGAYGPLETVSMEEIRHQFDTNLIGPLAVTKSVLPHMRACGSGMIVNISSIGGRVAMPLTSLYHGTKFAMEGISESLRFELEPCGIRIKLIEPGIVHTRFRDSVVFSNDETIIGYQPLVRALLASRKRFAASDAAIEPPQVAEVVWQAVTDGSDRLRYPVGSFAEEILTRRASEDDETFHDNIKTRMRV